MGKIKMVDLHSQYIRIKSEIDYAVLKVLDSTAFIQGPDVSDFAQRLSAYLGGTNVIPCANGTDALQIAMMALELQPGDEVILPVHTYVATAEVIALLRLTPVFVDVDGDTFNIDVDEVVRKITKRTKAIVPVHLYGQCVDMEKLMDVAKQHDLFVIEDAAQALGARLRFSNGSQNFAGTIGHIGCTSFFPSKNLGCFGDGGAIFTADTTRAQKIKMIANHGQEKKYHHDLIGVNSRLDTLQAAILSVKLKYFDDYNRSRNVVAGQYDVQLNGITEITIPTRVNYSTHVFNQYTIKVSKGRNELKKYLEEQGIPTMIYYPVPLHMQKAYSSFANGRGSFPVTEALSEQVLSLPMHTEMKEEDVQFIANVIKRFFGHE